MENIDGVPELVANDLILSKLKNTQKVLMQRQLKQRCYIERDGRMGLPNVSHIRLELWLIPNPALLFLLAHGITAEARASPDDNGKIPQLKTA